MDIDNKTQTDKSDNPTQKPIWVAPTLIEFQDELKPEGGPGSPYGESGLYRPMS